MTFDDAGLQRRMRMLRGQGMDPARRYHFPIVGFNYRLTNVAAAILCGQMERREVIVRRRREIVAIYAGELADVPGIGLRQDADWADTAPWLASCLVDPGLFGCRRDDLAESLADRGIETRPMFIPIHRMPPYHDAARKRRTELPVTDRLGSLGLMLPTYPQMADDITDCLSGDLNKDFSQLWKAIEEFVPLPDNLSVGAPLTKEETQLLPA